MSSALPTPEPTHNRHADVTVPDWNVVPFEVGCARCGHDLRGLTEPKCPACGLEFDWSEAVPIEQLICRHCGYHLYGLTETRCPECGGLFTWAEVLDDYHRKRKPLFEYHWRDRPFRSLVYTWWLALRPRKLWRFIDIHDRPRVGLLLVILVVATIALTVVGIVASFIEVAIAYWRFAREMAARGRSVPSFGGMLPEVARLAWNNRLLYEFAQFVGVWSIFTFASLLVFQQSLRRCRVRIAHVFRVCVYAVVGVAPLAAAVFFTTGAVLRGFDIFRFQTQFATVALALVLGFGARSVGQGYRRYIRMPHSIGVVIAAQVMAILASAIAGMWMFNSPRGIMEVVLEWLDSW